eukprot:gb/GECG01006389.1/.p1 GENE.gb/GECG01006389.1/~~gb/GECG01006389.1/.p1  ORF type:complete len:271 (+),score=46.23 gb/GECG01006389.1/:1-813(+)
MGKRSRDDAVAPKTPPRASAAGAAAPPVSPLGGLTKYSQDVSIEVKVTNICPLSAWKSDKGEGEVLSADLVDAELTEMRASFFNGSARKFSSVLKVGKAFRMCKGRIRKAKKGFSEISNPYEITFPPHAVIEEIEDDGSIAVPEKVAILRKKSLEDVEVGDRAVVEASIAFLFGTLDDPPWYMGEPGSKVKVEKGGTPMYLLKGEICAGECTREVTFFDAGGESLLGKSAAKVNEAGNVEELLEELKGKTYLFHVLSKAEQLIVDKVEIA